MSTESVSAPVALVTGADKGIGLETARRLAGAGYLTSDSNERGRAAAATAGVQLLELDVTSDEPVARLAKSLADQIRGPGFPAVWDTFETSMRIELLPLAAQELLRSGRNLRQDLITGYWRELLDRPVAELAEQTAAWLSALRVAKVRYLFIAGHEVEPGYQDWLSEVLPRACVMVGPGSGHFPQLAHPRRFAGCLAATAQWAGAYRSFAADLRLLGQRHTTRREP